MTIIIHSHSFHRHFSENFIIWQKSKSWESNLGLLDLSIKGTGVRGTINMLMTSFSALGENICLYRRRQWHPTPVLLPGKSHGWRSQEGWSPWGCWGSDTTEWLPFHFSLSCLGEGNGNPLQGSCLENPKDRGAWWAAVYGVAQSRTRLKRLSSSSSSMYLYCWIDLYIHSFISCF